MPRKCALSECGDFDHKHGGCKTDGCEFGRFFTLINCELDEYGPWTVRRHTRSCDDVLVAVTKGQRGRVEVWGGAVHRMEVWFMAGKSSPIQTELVAHDISGDALVDAVSRACALAAVQQRMEVGA